MKRIARITSLILTVCLLSSMLVACKDERYEAYDRTGEPYDYYLPSYVKVCEYTEIELPEVVYVPSAEDISNRLKQLAGYYCDRTEDPDRPCREYDYVDIITTCRFTDTGDLYSLFTFEKNSNDIGQTFLLGVNYFGITAIDDAVVGMKQGETKTVTLEIPDPFYKDYMNSGREIEMEIYLNYIDEVDFSGTDDQFYHDHYGYYGESMDNYIIQELVKEKNEDIKGYKEVLAWKYIMENSKLKKVPEKEFKEIYDETLANARADAQKEELTLLEYAKKYFGVEDLDAFYKDMEEYAENVCFEQMVYYYIMRRENITYTDEFYEERVLAMADQFDIKDFTEAESFLIYYMGAEELHKSILLQYTKNWIVQKAIIREDVNQFFSDKLN